MQNDLVTHEGSTWRARRDNVNSTPGAGPVWEQFAAAGEPQADGQAGDGEEQADGQAGDGEEQAASALAPPTGPAGGDLAGTYPNPTIRLGAVVTNRIANAAITFSKIAINSIGSGKIIDNQIVTADVRDDTLIGGGLAAVDLAPNSVGFSEIQTDAVQATEIADNSIDSGEIVDNSLFAVDLGTNSVGASELGTIVQRSVVSANIAGGANGSVTASCLSTEQVVAGGNDGFFDVFVVASRQSGNGWAVFAHNNSGGNRTITAHAYCLQ